MVTCHLKCLELSITEALISRTNSLDIRVLPAPSPESEG